MTICKTSDWPILRDRRESKPRLGSSAGGPLQKMSNVVAPHDTNPASTEDPRKFLPYTIFLFLLTLSFLLSISRPPPGASRFSGNPSHFLSSVLLAPGVGFEPTRPVRATGSQGLRR